MADDKRLDYLDSIRGIAAFYVMAFHCLFLVPPRYFENINLGTALHSSSNLIIYLIHKIFVQGHVAVIMFFVLSGFVLASSLAARPTTYLEFMIKRIFRIYPAFIVAILFSYVLHVMLISIPVPETSGWFHDLVASPPLTLDNLIRHLIMRGRITDITLDGVIWSLVHEMRISLLFPLIFFFVARYRRLSLPVAMAASALCVLFSLHFFNAAPKGFSEKTDMGSWITTLYLVPAFVVGILLSLGRTKISEIVSRLSPWTCRALLLVSAIGMFKSEGSITSWNSALTDLVFICCSAIVIALAIGSFRIQGFLRHPTLIWLGRISYSLYLLHIPAIYVVYMLVFDANNPWSFAIVIVLSIALALLLSEFMFVAIEQPFIGMGKHFSNKLAARKRT